MPTFRHLWLLNCSRVVSMTPLLLCTPTSRRKAVWGPKRMLALLVFFSLGLAPKVFAKGGPHPHQPAHARPGVAGRKANHPKLENSLNARSKGRPNDVTS